MLRRDSPESPLSMAFWICLPVVWSALASMVAMAEVEITTGARVSDGTRAGSQMRFLGWC